MTGVQFKFKNGDSKFVKNLDVADFVKELNKADINNSPMVNINNKIVINMKEINYFEYCECGV